MADNRIVLENAKIEGRTDRSYWDAAHSNQIEGYATDFSVNAGETVNFKINVNGQASATLPYKVEIYRLGHYGGAGAREVAEFVNADGTVQANPLYDESRGLVDAGNWSVSDTWEVPADAVSGVYLARIQRLDANGNAVAGATNQIPFVVRNDGVAADIVLQTSDTTWQAYNGWAGNNGKVGPSFYGDPADMVDHAPVADPGHTQDRAYAVSYNRPFITRDAGGVYAGPQDYLFGADYAAISWLEKNGYSTSYVSGVDTDRLGADYLTKYKAFISVGHDEYWSGEQRANVEAARDAGVNLLFWSGNEMYWKTRWEEAISSDGTPYRTLVCYKETLANRDPNAGPEDYANIDPSNIWTGTWRDIRFHEAVDANGNYIAGGAAHLDPVSGLRGTCNCAENSLIGQLFGPDGTGEFGGALDVPTDYGSLRVWRGTAATNGELDVAPGIIGYEWDVVPDDANRPAGLIKLSETTIDWGSIVVDQGNQAVPGTATHSLSLYRDPESGALVFGAGTVFWSWGLSDEHDNSPYGASIANSLLKQFTVNMFADMGIQPGSIEAGLNLALESADEVGAVADMADLPGTVAAGSTLRITGTATDNDGNAATSDGMVALIEISFDGGKSWKVAEGTTSWSYEWRPLVQGSYTVSVRAIDDSLNVTNLTVDRDTVAVTAPPRPSTFSLFDPGSSLPSGTATYNDNQALELGMRFTVSENGSVTELKYYRSAADAGDTDVREGHLWRVSDGALLGTVTFTSASGKAGWQVASLANPVALVAGAEYVVSYRTSNNYVATDGFFAPGNELAFDGLDDDAFSDPFVMIHAPQDTTTGVKGNGLYEYGTSSVIPNNTYRSTNYWTDVTFRPAPTTANAPPAFTSASFTVEEATFAVGTVTATDPDGDPLTFSIAGGADGAFFNVDAQTGALTVLSPANFEAPGDTNGNNVYEVRLGVTDGHSNTVFRDVTVTVTDVNEAPTALALSAATVTENASPRHVVGILSGSDPDAGSILTYSLVDSAGGRFALDGDRLIVAPTGPGIDREAAASYTVTVRVTDQRGASYDRSFAIGIGDVDEFDVTKPADSNAAANTVAEGASAGTTVGITALAADADATSNDVTYSLADSAGGRFVINATSGVVSVAPGALFGMAAAPSHQVTVMAASSDGSTSAETFTVNVTAAPRIKVNLTIRSDTYTAPDGRSYEVQGLDGADVITTLGGNDLVNGGTGHDRISTGDGQDIIEVTGASGGDDAINGGGGIDLIRATAVNTTLRLSSLAGVEQISANGFAGVRMMGSSTSNSFDLSGVALTGIVSIDMGSGDDTVIGSGGQDAILGGIGVDNLQGGGGDDVINGGEGHDVLSGGVGNDTFILGSNPGADTINGGTGIDKVQIDVAGLTLSLAKLTSVESILAAADNVTLSGTTGADSIDYGSLGWSGIRLIDAGSGNDIVIGGAPKDRIAGRAGADRLTGGGDVDDFIYFATTDSLSTGTDTITDFEAGVDNLDLAAIDASTLVAGNNDFTFIGNSAFSRVAGQLRYDATSFSGQTRVYADVNGDARADMEIRLTGSLMLSPDDILG